MATPSSGSSPYCTSAKFLEFYDWRTVGELLADADSVSPLNQSQVLASTLLTDLLASASGEVEASFLTGARYQITPPGNTDLTNDLLAIQDAGGNGAALLAELVADLCMWKLFKRRPLRDPKLQLPAAAIDAQEKLKLLRQGELIFGTVEGQAAGHMNDVVEQPSSVFERYGVTVQARRLFGQRSNQSTSPRQVGP